MARIRSGSSAPATSPTPACSRPGRTRETTETVRAFDIVPARAERFTKTRGVRR
jgi:hypothetical protein